MKCDTPTIAFRRPGINPDTGNHYSPVSFRQFWRIFKDSSLPRHEKERIMVDYYRSCPDGLEAVLMPCKHCLLCMRAYRRAWAYRLMCESNTAGESMYITLTVAPEHLETVFPGCSLRHDPFQKFMKRLRITLERGYDYDYIPPYTPIELFGKLPRTMQKRNYKRSKIRFYMCGEYGDESMRPHYHVCVFGARFPDAYFQKKVGSNAYFSSPTLSKLWPYGFPLFSDVTPKSAAYVAGYVDKKLERSQEQFKEAGLMPEYVRMSNGLGLDYFNLFSDQLYRRCSDGSPFIETFSIGDSYVPAPPYFDQKLQLLDPEFFGKLKSARECRRLSRMRQVRVDEMLNESGRKNSVLLARKKVREVRELT